jgi:hypothetical protein
VNKRNVAHAAAAALALACAPHRAGTARPSAPLDAAAERYVKLALSVGEVAPDYVDAYYGPAEWKDDAARAGKRPVAELAREAEAVLAAARAAPAAGEEASRRRDHLVETIASLRAYLGLLGGEKLSFDDEARALYGLAPPRRELSSFDATLGRLDAALPGDGPVAARLVAFRKRFEIPAGSLDRAMRLGMEEVRRRTAARVALPQGERVTLTYVTGQPWAAYNWYRGGGLSDIELNTDHPVPAENALALPAHEGYPGHHLLNTLRETRLTRERGWIEYTVFPLFGPDALIAEGSAEYGVDLVFPIEERITLLRETIFPAAGLDPAEAERYASVSVLARELSDEAAMEVARRYLDGELTAVAASLALQRFGTTPERAEQRVRFFDRYRSYVINYPFGRALVKAAVEARGSDPAARWAAFVEIIAEPTLPSALAPSAR